MTHIRQSLYDRLPEIYRIKDEEQLPAGQLKAWLGILDQTQAALHDNIEALYHDLFIETCHDWVIPYIADALGTSHLSGDPWTLRADVARTIKHRRRKGTLGSIESLTYALSRWAVHTVELRERIAWNQHLNHQRPARFGAAPLSMLMDESESIAGAVRGGTINLRDPALLSFYDGPFDPFARVIDVKPTNTGATRPNIPNLAIFLWRLQAFTLPVIQPLSNGSEQVVPEPGEAEFLLGFDLHPLGEPMVLFNTHRYNADAEPPDLTGLDAVPGPMPVPRLSEETLTGNPNAYIDLLFYADTADVPSDLSDDRVGLTLYLPDSLAGADWRFRGADLRRWQECLYPPLNEYEIAIDPEHGRVLFGVTNQTTEVDVIADGFFASPSYGFSGSTGAHPEVRNEVIEPKISVSFDEYTDESGVTHAASNGSGLQEALANLADRSAPLVIEITDSRIYSLNLNAVAGIGDELGLRVLRLTESLHIRAASGQRPFIRLTRPLAFRPDNVTDPGVDNLNVHLEGLYITWQRTSPLFAATTALIERAALNRLRIEQCTLDPGSYRQLDGSRRPARYGVRLGNDYGFDPAGGEDFEQLPQVQLINSICGPMAMDSGYQLLLENSIVDAASGVGDDAPDYAVHEDTGDWGPQLTVKGMTSFGRFRVESATGEGGIWIHSLEVHDTLNGCIEFSYFAADGNHLPQHQGCVFASDASLSFASEVFGDAGFAQIRLRSDARIINQGPGNDEMGAFGYLSNSHKWKNINIRYREFMPVGIQPVLIAVT